MVFCRLCLFFVVWQSGSGIADGSLQTTPSTPVEITVVNADTGAVLPCRLYVQDVQANQGAGLHAQVILAIAQHINA